MIRSVTIIFRLALSGLVTSPVLADDWHLSRYPWLVPDTQDTWTRAVATGLEVANSTLGEHFDWKEFMQC